MKLKNNQKENNEIKNRGKGDHPMIVVPVNCPEAKTCENYVKNNINYEQLNVNGFYLIDVNDEIKNEYYNSNEFIYKYSNIFGKVEGFDVQHNGQNIQDIIPNYDDQYKQTYGSSRTILEMHTELAFLENPPDYILLYCVRPDHDNIAETYLYDSFYALKFMSPNEKNILSMKKFKFGVDQGATNADKIQQFPCFPIINENHNILLRYDIDLCEATCEESYKAIKKFDKILKRFYFSIKMQENQILIINNKRIIHSRSPFFPRFDGNDRWLKRAFINKK